MHFHPEFHFSLLVASVLCCISIFNTIPSGLSRCRWAKKNCRIKDAVIKQISLARVNGRIWVMPRKRENLQGVVSGRIEVKFWVACLLNLNKSWDSKLLKKIIWIYCRVFTKMFAVIAQLDVDSAISQGRFDLSLHASCMCRTSKLLYLIRNKSLELWTVVNGAPRRFRSVVIDQLV